MEILFILAAVRFRRTKDSEFEPGIVVEVELPNGDTVEAGLFNTEGKQVDKAYTIVYLNAHDLRAAVFGRSEANVRFTFKN